MLVFVGLFIRHPLIHIELEHVRSFTPPIFDCPRFRISQRGLIQLLGLYIFDRFLRFIQIQFHLFRGHRILVDERGVLDNSIYFFWFRRLLFDQLLLRFGRGLFHLKVLYNLLLGILDLV